MGNYITNADIVDHKGLSSARIDEIIEAFEQQVEIWCRDVFYKKSLTFHFSGNGNAVIIFRRLPAIISISQIESRSSSNLYTALGATSYRYDKHKVKRQVGGYFAEGFLNYRITMDVGHDTTDFEGVTDTKYKPQLLKEALNVLIVNFLNDYIGTSSSGTVGFIATPEIKMKSEDVGQGDYSYTRALSFAFSANSDTPSGIPFVDDALRSLRRKRLTAKTLGKSYNRLYYDYSLADVYAQRV